jgi:hypothetical protein
MLKFCVKIFILKAFFSPLNTFMRKGKYPDPYILLMDLDPDPGGSKTCGSCASEYPTLSKNMLNLCRVSTTYSCYNSIPHSLV